MVLAWSEPQTAHRHPGKGESGKPTPNSAIYGYKKDPQDKHHWLIDEEAAVVRRIFRLTIDGHGPYKIARILFDDLIDTPAVYFAKKGIGAWKNKKEFPNPYNWSGFVVGQILSKPEYMGDTVNFRTHKELYKDKSTVPNPKEDWLIFENTHEAIVDRETWALAQKLRKTPKCIDENGLDAVKSILFEIMAKERPELYKQVDEFLKSIKEN